MTGRRRFEQRDQGYRFVNADDLRHVDVKRMQQALRGDPTKTRAVRRDGVGAA